MERKQAELVKANQDFKKVNSEIQQLATRKQQAEEKKD